MPAQDWGGDPVSADARLSPAEHYDMAMDLIDQAKGFPVIDANNGYLGAIAHGVAGLLRVQAEQSS